MSKKAIKNGALLSLLCGLFVLAGSAFAQYVPSRDSLAADKVYRSSHVLAAQTTANIIAGRGVLHKVVVSSGVASATIQIFDSVGNGIATGSRLKLDASDEREYTFDIGFSSGITYTTVGTAHIQMIYGDDDTSVIRSSHVIAALTGDNIVAGRGVLRQVIMDNGEAAGGSPSLTLYDSVGSADITEASTATARRIIQIDGDEERNIAYNVFFSSGLTFTTVGTADWIILYEKLYP